jgi:hypothetical protein
MKIVQATAGDIPAIMKLIEASVRDMESKGILQWDALYPNRSVIQSDIDSGTLFRAGENQHLFGIIVINEHQEPQYGKVPWSIPGERILVVH